MSVVAIRCPTCSSVASSTTTPNEYFCTYCQRTFPINRPADATVTTDLRAHYCPMCGRAVQTTQSFKCTECGKIDFCTNCVASVPGTGAPRYVCRACMIQKGWACSNCGEYATSVCVNCRKRACGIHVSELFGLKYTKAGETLRVEYFKCLTCNGQLCGSCVLEKKGIFSTKYYCGKCNTELQLTSRPSRSCKACGHSVEGQAAFCRNCGKALY
jgi:membrane protease subunit (stomatin/prohibitin family)